MFAILSPLVRSLYEGSLPLKPGSSPGGGFLFFELVFTLRKYVRRFSHYDGGHAGSLGALLTCYLLFLAFHQLVLPTLWWFTGGGVL